MTHAVVLRTAGKTVTVRSATEAVTNWSARYFGPWWSVTLALDGSDRPEVVAEESPNRTRTWPPP